MIMVSVSRTTTVASASWAFDKMSLPSIQNKGSLLRSFTVQQRRPHHSSVNHPVITHYQTRRPTTASTTYARSSDLIHKHQTSLPSPSAHIRLEHGSSKAPLSSVDDSDTVESSGDANLQMSLDRILNRAPQDENSNALKEEPQSADTYLQEGLEQLLHPDPQYEGHFKFLDSEHLKEEICVLRNENYIYTVLPVLDGLAHDGPASRDILDSLIYFLKLMCSDRGSETKRNVTLDGTICHFARLGRLACQDMRTKSRWLTNHVLLVNITTQPKSLWLAYDYVRYDDDLKGHLRSLEDPPNYLQLVDRKWYQGKKTFLDAESNPPSTIDQSLIREPPKGILGFQDPFDLAVLSRDIRADWKGRVQSGLDPKKVRQIMREDHWLYGNTLRAVPSLIHIER